MSVLGRDALLARLRCAQRDEQLVVRPIYDEALIGRSSIDLRMGNEVLLVRSRGLAEVNPTKYVKSRIRPSYEGQLDSQQKFERYHLPFGAKFLLHPGVLALVPTLEWVRLPVDLQGVVTARSSWAREGLSIATANFIDPEYKGIITLELANLGPIPLRLYAGLRIAQIAFYLIEGKTARAEKSSQFSGAFSPAGGLLLDPDIDPTFEH